MLFQTCLYITIFLNASFSFTDFPVHTGSPALSTYTKHLDISGFKAVKHSSFLSVFKLYKFYIPFQNFQYAPSVIIPISCQSINISWNGMNNKAISVSIVVNWLCSWICILGSGVSTLLFLSVWLVKEEHSLQQDWGQSAAL